MISTTYYFLTKYEGVGGQPNFVKYQKKGSPKYNILVINYEKTSMAHPLLFIKQIKHFTNNRIAHLKLGLKVIDWRLLLREFPNKENIIIIQISWVWVGLTPEPLG